jgi:DNA (cytosine-5)-methyltransferase 1
MQPTVGSLFSGIGGIDLSFQQAGFTVQWQCEINLFARMILEKHFPGLRIYEDVTMIEGGIIPPVDVLTFGSPCQDLSTAGTQLGLSGARSSLFFEAVRIAHEMREATDGRSPTFLVFENVDGLFASNRGRDFALVLRALAELRPLDIAWRLLNSQFFGVPQRRRRIFIVADFRATRSATILFEPESRPRYLAASRKTGADIAASLTAGAHRPGVNSPGRHHEDDYNLVAHALSAHHARDDPNQQDYVVVPFDTTNVTHHLNYSNPKPGDPCHALHQGDAPSIASAAGMVRRLTPLECTRLQGFPDGWVDGLSDTQQYTLLGNAVAVPVLRWIAERMLAQWTQ